LLAASDETREKMRNETLTEMREALDNEVHEVYGEVHEPYDDLREVESKVEQAFNESHNKLYEAQKVAGATNAIGVGRKKQILLALIIQSDSINRLLIK